jgi:hypothetical protein
MDQTSIDEVGSNRPADREAQIFRETLDQKILNILRCNKKNAQMHRENGEATKAEKFRPVSYLLLLLSFMAI